MGAICGGGVALAFQDSAAAWVLPADAGRRRARRHGLGGDPGLAAHALQRQRDPGQPDAGLRRQADAVAAGARPVARSARASTFRSRRCSPTRRCCRTSCPARASTPGCCSPSPSVAAAGCSCARALPASRCRSPVSLRPRPITPASPRRRTVWLGMLDRRRQCAGIAGVARRPGRSASCCRRCRRATASPPSSWPSSAGCIRSASSCASLLMSLLYLGGEAAQIDLALPSAVTGLFQGMLLFFLLAADVFINFRLRIVRRAPPPSRRRAASPRRGAASGTSGHARRADARRGHAAGARGARRAGHREGRRAQPWRRRHDAGGRGGGIHRRRRPPGCPGWALRPAWRRRRRCRWCSRC